MIFLVPFHLSPPKWIVSKLNPVNDLLLSLSFCWPNGLTFQASLHFNLTSHNPAIRSLSIRLKCKVKFNLSWFYIFLFFFSIFLYIYHEGSLKYFIFSIRFLISHDWSTQMRSTLLFNLPVCKKHLMFRLEREITNSFKKHTITSHPHKNLYKTPWDQESDSKFFFSLTFKNRDTKKCRKKKKNFEPVQPGMAVLTTAHVIKQVQNSWDQESNPKKIFLKCWQ